MIYLNHVRFVAAFSVVIVASAFMVIPAVGTLQLESVKAWYWTGETEVYSVVVADVDGDGANETVTGGRHWDGARYNAQLVVWSGSGLAVEAVTTWYWTGNTFISSVAAGDVDGDDSIEIVTGGYHHDGTRENAQLVVWSSTLAVENVKTWYWTSHTEISSVAVGDVEGDDSNEIVTGGFYQDGTRLNAQLCVWDGSNLDLESVTAWYWTSHTYIKSVAVGDVDADGSVEIVSGGYHYDGTRNVAQLVVWSGSALEVENVKTWYATEGNTGIYSVAVGDVDADGFAEIVTGGFYSSYAQLCVWSGSTLALENVMAWYWIGVTVIYSVAVADVDGDGSAEIVTGGCYWDGARYNAQLVVWSGSDLTVEDVTTWFWTSHTGIYSVAVDDVDADASNEIVTGGYYYDGITYYAQLVVWAKT